MSTKIEAVFFHQHLITRQERTRFKTTIYHSSDNWLLLGPKVRRDLNTAIPIHNCDNIVSFLYGYFMFRILKVNFYPADIKIITIIKTRLFL